MIVYENGWAYSFEVRAWLRYLEAKSKDPTVSAANFGPCVGFVSLDVSDLTAESAQHMLDAYQSRGELDPKVAEAFAA